MRPLALIALYAAFFLAVSSGVRELLGWPEASGLRKKLAHYEADPEGYDLVFLGSSNVMCSIIPEVFERELAGRGHRLRTYNLGVAGMLTFETDNLVEHVLASRPERLRYAVVELTAWRADPRIGDPTERNVSWHTPANTCTLLETAWRTEGLSRMGFLSYAREHAELALWRMANAGVLQQRLLVELGLAEEEAWTLQTEPAREGGFVALEELGDSGAEAGRQRFLGDLERYQKQVQELRRQQPDPGPPPASLLPGAERRLALFRDAGIEPVHVLFALSQSDPVLLQLGPPDGPLTELWNFCDPNAYPQLFKLPARYDNRHLSRAGAEHFSRLLAQRFADHLDAQSEP